MPYEQTCNSLEWCTWFTSRFDWTLIFGWVKFVNSKSWLTTNRFVEYRLYQWKCMLIRYVWFRGDMTLWFTAGERERESMKLLASYGDLQEAGVY